MASLAKSCRAVMAAELQQHHTTATLHQHPGHRQPVARARRVALAVHTAAPGVAAPTARQRHAFVAAYPRSFDRREQRLVVAAAGFVTAYEAARQHRRGVGGEGTYVEAVPALAAELASLTAA